ncbi:hypothetical protein QBC33DRAFT_531363 [Phialemonium atrogriseum]|uniref:Uncharacterized protein n=1 Tax=Phialemonium atrogriseum TaxID=1093897 RepID=A0AAJ0C6H4_9PEZI|nr:uncharacterized protein QBC33DRAFT_531363 [Phialemonium atrogriseum]KAK1769612.1 hypothetical protein QBC33DRAFT_531363 [Phialemonium atrogriseum]
MIDLLGRRKRTAVPQFRSARLVQLSGSSSKLQSVCQKRNNTAIYESTAKQGLIYALTCTLCLSFSSPSHFQLIHGAPPLCSCLCVGCLLRSTDLPPSCLLPACCELNINRAFSDIPSPLLPFPFSRLETLDRPALVLGTSRDPTFLSFQTDPFHPSPSTVRIVATSRTSTSPGSPGRLGFNKARKIQLWPRLTLSVSSVRGSLMRVWTVPSADSDLSTPAKTPALWREAILVIVAAIRC